MLKRANINWNARQLCKMVQKNTIRFDNAVQRGYVWDVKRKSLLIHSMLTGYPIPPFYAAKSGDEYDMLDGKQRTGAIVDFLNGKFELTDIPEVEVSNDDGTTDMVDINTLHFDELEEALRDELSNYSLTVYYFDGITDDEISEMRHSQKRLVRSMKRFNYSSRHMTNICVKLIQLGLVTITKRSFMTARSISRISLIKTYRRKSLNTSNGTTRQLMRQMPSPN